MTDDLTAPRLRHETHFGRVMRCFADRPASVETMVREAVAAAPDAVALIDGDERWTYADLDGLVATVAANLSGLGVDAGDRVAILLDNRVEFVVAVLACARIGAISTPMNIRQKRPETEFLLNDSGAVVLIHEADLAGELPEPSEVPALRWRLSVGGEASNWPELLRPAAPKDFPPTSEEDVFCILYTSGTTGRPKGALLTHLNVVHSCLHFEHHLGLEHGDVALLAVPASHVTGLVAIILTMIRMRGATILMRRFKARRMLELIASEKMTYTLVVPAMYSLCLLEPDIAAFDLSSWRVGGFGGAPMPEAVIGQLAAAAPGLTLYNIYGATETTSPAVFMPKGEIAAHGDSVGQPAACCELIVMDDDGREVAPGQSGEIWMAGPMVVPGYWRNPDATTGAFTAGYWKSGDIGSLDTEGYVRVFDRKKDMINRGGFKIYSIEVENVLTAHPAVIEAGVVGRPCPVLGERVEAFVTVSGPADPAELRAFCAERLSDYKVPDTVRLRNDPLPRNANGKLQKAILRRWLEQA